MSVIEIRQARRAGARLVVGISGISGSGKTYTALQLAWGMANYDASKVGFLDTENRRGSLYADALRDDQGTVHPFLIGDLYPPFSPARYSDAIQEFQKAGVEVLVIDSVTHEWEGQGGCEDIAHNSRSRMADWKTAKAEHKRFMNAMLQCDMHIICCIRAREKVSVEKVDGKTVVTPLGIMPVQEKNFMFEMTASVMMWDEGRSQQVMKCPADLRPILGREQDYITAADGKALRDWVDGAQQLDPKVEQWRNRLQSNTEKGEAHLKACWDQTPEPVRVALGEGFRDQLFSSARSFDDQRRGAAGHDEDLADLNAALSGGQDGTSTEG